MKYSYLYILLCLSCIPFTAVAQANVIHFSPDDYHAAGQNWSIMEWNDHIYCANHDGLLRYNGNDWDKLSAIEQQNVKVMHVYNERIYTAGENTIGYWSVDPYKKPAYHSLYDQLQKLGIEDVAFWSIAHSDSIIYFQSFSHIVGFKGDSCFVVVNQDCYSEIYTCGRNIYTKRFHGGIYTIRNDSLLLQYNHPLLNTYDMQFCIEGSNDELLIGLSNGCIYRVGSNEWHLLCNCGIGLQFSCACFVNDSTLAVGTRGNGIYFVNTNNGRYHSVAHKQMLDLNIHHICYHDDILWTALDNGIEQIALNSGRELLFRSADLGVLVSFAHFQNIDWIATNRGLFMSPAFSKVPIDGLPLHLFVFNNQLFCGTTEKLYRLNRDGVQEEWPINGVQETEAVLDGYETILIVRSNAGLGVMRMKDGSMSYSSIDGTQDYQKMVPESARNIWILHNSGQLSRLRLNQTLTAVDASIDFPIDGSIKPISMMNVDNQLLFICADGIYTYQARDSVFVRSDMIWENQESIKTVIRKNANEIWVAAGDFLYLYHVEDMQTELLQKHILCGTPLLQYNKTYAVFPDNYRVLFGTGDGAILMNVNSELPSDNKRPFIEYCTYTLKNQKHYTDITNGRISIPAKATDITIHCALGIVSDQAYISYSMTPLHGQWTSWNTSGQIVLSSLATGTYHLAVRGAYGSYSTDILYVDIVSQPPFYASVWAFLLYAVLVILLFVIIQRLVLRYKTRKLKEQNRIEREKQEALLNEEKAKVLAITVENQKAELQSNLRVLTQKQELIDAITEELNKMERDSSSARDGYIRLLRIVQSKSSTQSKVFSLENYFADVQKDFISRLHPRYPDLTQAEMRLCCMIRSNLMTKEIAAIFGIAPRSVELKKYRLKKHLGLNAESDLTAFLLSV